MRTDAGGDRSRWVRSGLAHLTGPENGPGDLSRARVLDEAERVRRRFDATMRALAPGTPGRRSVGEDAGMVLAGRAGLLGATRRGRISVGGASRLIRSADAWLAVTLSRADDIDLVPALLESDVGSPGAAWSAISRAFPARTGDAWVARARLLGLPVARLGECPAEPIRRRARGRPHRHGPRDPLLVVDLSSMWAGPLATRLLADRGARVIKVESPDRPDGTRSQRAFFDWINHGKLSCAVDFDRAADDLRQLLAMADVVVEGSRPDALRRRALDQDSVPARAGQVWVRLTAHGAEGERGTWVGFGDDAAVAGGLVAQMADGPVFCGDAIADPLTGIEVADAIASALAGGGGTAIDVSLSGTAARYAALGVDVASPIRECPAPPAPEIIGPGPALGADNAILRELIARARCDHPSP
ncbi:MAG: CoA transferase [Gordonia sp. (in: high G+C Gram-positive bacteria)]